MDETFCITAVDDKGMTRIAAIIIATIEDGLSAGQFIIDLVLPFRISKVLAIFIRGAIIVVEIFDEGFWHII